MPKIFTLKTDMSNSAITESDQGYPSFIQELKTYKITKKNNSFIIYEVNRKKRDKIVRKFTAKKKQTINSVINDVKNNKIKLRITYENTRDTPYNKVTIRQFNTTPRIPKRSLLNVQMLALVQITDSHQDITTVAIGFSRKYNNPFTKYKLNIMERQCIDNAVNRYVAINYFGTTDYKDLDIPAGIYGKILEKRFQYVTASRKIKKV